MLSTRHEIRGGPRAQASLDSFFDDVNAWPEASGRIFHYLAGVTKEGFDNEGRVEKWPDYWQQEPKYGMKKLGIFSDEGNRSLFPNLLRWTTGNEVLFPSLMSAQHPDAVRRVTDQGFVYGTSVPYAGRHQHGIGTNEEGEPIPRRRFLIIEARDEAEARRIIAQEVGI